MLADEIALFLSKVKMASPSLISDVFGMPPVRFGSALALLRRNNVIHKVGRNWIFGPKPVMLPKKEPPVIRLPKAAAITVVRHEPKPTPQPMKLPANSVWEWRG